MFMEGHVYIGMDIGGTKIAAAVVTEGGEILARKKEPTPRNARPQDIWTTAHTLIDKILAAQHIRKESLLGIGVGVPGIVDKNQADILVTPNINLTGFPLVKRLKERYAAKVLLGNDVNLGVLGETWLGAGRGVKNVVGLFPGTGVGGGVVCDGKMLLGTRGAAAELGHMMMDRKGPACSCGNHGCLEAFAGRWAIERDIRDAIKAGQKTIVMELSRKKQASTIKSGVLAEAIKRKDKVVLRVMTDVCDVLGHACVSVKHIFNPDVIILGGGVIEACEGFMLPKINKIFKADPFFADIDHCRIVSSTLGDDAVILGAVALVRRGDKSRRDAQAIIYPKIKMNKGHGMVVGTKIIAESFYIRCNGKVKKMSLKQMELIYNSGRSFPLSVVKKACRNKPDILIVGKPDQGGWFISAEARAYARANAVKIKHLPMAEAITAYHTLTQPRALLIQQ